MLETLILFERFHPSSSWTPLPLLRGCGFKFDCAMALAIGPSLDVLGPRNGGQHQMESVRNSIPFEILRFRAGDAAGLPGRGSRFLLGVDRNESYEPNHPPGKPYHSEIWLARDLLGVMVTLGLAGNGRCR